MLNYYRGHETIAPLPPPAWKVLRKRRKGRQSRRERKWDGQIKNGEEKEERWSLLNEVRSGKKREEKDSERG